MIVLEWCVARLQYTINRRHFVINCRHFVGLCKDFRIFVGLCKSFRLNIARGLWYNACQRQNMRTYAIHKTAYNRAETARIGNYPPPWPDGTGESCQCGIVASNQYPIPIYLRQGYSGYIGYWQHWELATFSHFHISTAALTGITEATCRAPCATSRLALNKPKTNLQTASKGGQIRKSHDNRKSTQWKAVCGKSARTV